MQIIVCGASEVGFTLVSSLAAEGHSVVVIDSSEEITREMNAELDVQALLGNCLDPVILRQAGAEDADILISVEPLSETNLVVGMLARNLFKVPTIAVRLWGKVFHADSWQSMLENGPIKIDYFIEPEKDVARLIVNTVRVAGANEVFYFSRSDVQVTGLRLREDCPLIHTPLRQLSEIFPYQMASVVLLRRDGKIMIADADTSMQPKDEVYVINDTEQSWRTAQAFGLEPIALKRYLIVGGGNVGLALIKILEQDAPQASITIIENDKQRANMLAESLSSSRISVIEGNVLDERVMSEINLPTVDALLAVTDSDETNVFGALLGKRKGVKRVVALVAHHSRYPELLEELEIDVFINPREVTVSGVLQYVRKGKVRSVHAVFDRKAEIVEFEALETSDIVQKPLGEVRMPKGVRIGGIVRDNEGFIRPNKDTVVRKGDFVIVAALRESVKDVEKLFSVQLDYF